MKYRMSDAILFFGVIITILILIISTIFNPDLLLYLRFWWVIFVPFAIIFNFFPKSKTSKWLSEERKRKNPFSDRTIMFFKWMD